MRGALKGALVMLLICVGVFAAVAFVIVGKDLIAAGYWWAAWGGAVILFVLIGACMGYEKPHRPTPER